MERIREDAFSVKNDNCKTYERRALELNRRETKPGLCSVDFFLFRTRLREIKDRRPPFSGGL